MIIIVTGGRDYADMENVHRRIMDVFQSRTLLKNEALNIWHGGAKGADALASRLAQLHGWSDVPFPAQWHAQGRSAGPKRNEYMVSLAASLKADGHTVAVLAFPGGRGTADCVSRAKKHGLQVVHADGGVA